MPDMHVCATRGNEGVGPAPLPECETLISHKSRGIVARSAAQPLATLLCPCRGKLKTQNGDPVNLQGIRSSKVSSGNQPMQS